MIETIKNIENTTIQPCILGIETSCDETGVAIYDATQGLIADVLYSQVAMHAQYGGVVPELASRDHIRKTIPLIKQALTQANKTLDDISAIAYTAGPGLIGALLVGATIGKTLGLALNKPTIAVNHMEAHLLAIFLENHQPHFPFITLLVSGGHTQLVQVDAIGKYTLLGETLDDASGEAFDKVAKIIGIPYPGGVALTKLAQHGNPQRFRFPRPMTQRKGLDFSFSGLKTFALNTFNATDKTEQDKCDIAYAFQDAITDTLVIKCKRAIHQTKLNTLTLAGGVSANQELRRKLQILADKENIQLFCPQVKYCTDNGAMVAYAGYRRYLLSNIDSNLAINVFPRCDM